MGNTYKPTGKSFEIKTIKEFFKVVTKENIDFIIQDFRSCLEIGLEFDELETYLLKNKTAKHEKMDLTSFIWTDDGKNEVLSVKITDRKNRNNYLEFGKKYE